MGKFIQIIDSNVDEILTRKDASVLLLGKIGFSKKGNLPKASLYHLSAPKSHTPRLIEDPIGLPGDLDHKDGTFDLVISLGWYESVVFLRWSFQEVIRVLKPGGLAMFLFPVVQGIVPNTSRYRPPKEKPFDSLKRRIRSFLSVGSQPVGMPLHEIEEILKSAGLDVLSANSIGNIGGNAANILINDTCLTGSNPHHYGHLIAFICRISDLTSSAFGPNGSFERLDQEVRCEYAKELAQLSQFEQEFASFRGLELRPVEFGLASPRSLVLSPHPDDELIGAGGTIMQIVENGGRVQILQLTNGQGALALRSSAEYLRRQVRLDEAKFVANELGAQISCWADVDDMSLVVNDDTSSRLLDTLRELQPNTIFVPFMNDPHRDHFVANELLARTIRHYDNLSACTVLSYEVWSFCPYNAFVDISRYASRKSCLMKAYRTAIRAVDYGRKTQSIGAWHYHHICGEAGTAEVFLMQTAEEYLRMFDHYCTTNLWRHP